VEKVFQLVRGDQYKEFSSPRQKILKFSTFSTGCHVLAVSYFSLENMIIDILCNSTLMKRDPHEERIYLYMI
jgi:hypothetical protein